MSELDHEAIRSALRRSEKLIAADLSDFSFDDEPLDSAQFEDCDAASTRFVGGELATSHWTRSRFNQCEFANVNLAGARFEDCRFFDGDSAKGCTFRFCDLRGTTFRNCDLMLATFNVCELWDVTFSGCRMSGATFEKPGFAFRSTRQTKSKKPVRLAGTFETCKMDNVVLRDADLSSLRIIDCDLSGAELQGTSLVNASLRGSNLTNAALRLADLSGADLRGADLSGFDLQDIQSFSGMQISASQQHHLLRSLGIDVFADED
ncbi:pentapeptide repeat-containing protein [Bradyrhizobium ontarionense]|uniref:Pentapeptide repeat-containing protein n=1 Tax=Bradyrhizobium ontarionense TaxID=2898149 RepID=A0ABY3R653_9BRAD|nr:pentapeptide repeat-containing protein [Bradyrhizobium sp. A19]UFZ02223.1 pentapeptide repeat-containing protein [Bradyrhizobium sp. A19]